MLAQEDVKNAFIFLNRKRDIATLADGLIRKGYNAGPLHGDMVQAKRNETLQAFKDGKITLLVCSDVAARGLDVSNVSHVFNYDVPMHPDDYVHRIGRTGRAGREGRAWMIGTEDDKKYIDAIEKLIKKDIERVDVSTLGGSDAEEKPRASRSRDRDRDNDRERRPRDQKNPRSTPKNAPRADKPAFVREEEDEGDSVVGFGDDVPAFLR